MRDFRQILLDLATTVDAPLLRGFSGELTLNRKRDNELVTNVDHEVHNVASKFLLERGFSSVVSEEDENASTATSEYWLLDPLDGTIEFAKLIPEFAFSAAWIVNGVVEAALVSNPAWGFRALGTREHGIATQLRSPLPYPTATTLVSRSELSRDLFSGFPSEPPLQPMGSVALKLALVAAGYAHSTVSVQPKHAWDVAGGVGLVEMAGGSVSDLAGQLFRFPNGAALMVDGIFAAKIGTDASSLRERAGQRLRELREAP